MDGVHRRGGGFQRPMSDENRNFISAKPDKFGLKIANFQSIYHPTTQLWHLLHAPAYLKGIRSTDIQLPPITEQTKTRDVMSGGSYVAGTLWPRGSYGRGDVMTG